MGLRVARVRFTPLVPELSGILDAVRQRIGTGLDVAHFRVEGSDVLVSMGLDSVWFAYVMRVLMERGGVHVDWLTKEPSGYTCPEYTAKPWLEYPHSERVAIDDRENAFLDLAVSWRRFRPRCLDLLYRDPGTVSLQNELARIMGPGVTIEQLGLCANPVQRKTITHLVHVACEAPDPLHAEFARACLWAISYILSTHLGEATAGIDFTKAVCARRFLETLCVVAPFDAFARAAEWAEDPSSGARALAVQLLADAESNREPA
jgi:hypothetical protein